MTTRKLNYLLIFLLAVITLFAGYLYLEVRALRGVRGVLEQEQEVVRARTKLLGVMEDENVLLRKQILELKKDLELLR